MKLLVTGTLLGVVMGVVAAIAYSGYHLLQEISDNSDLFWE